jgi:hypothetical protein
MSKVEKLPFKLFVYNFDDFNGELIKKVEVTDLKSNIFKYSYNKYYLPLIISPVGELIICNNSHFKFYNYIKRESQETHKESTYEAYSDLWTNHYVTIDISLNNFGKMENIYYASHKILKHQYNILELLAIHLECNLFEINHKKLYAVGNMEDGLMGGNRLNGYNKYIIEDSYITQKYKPLK